MPQVANTLRDGGWTVNIINLFICLCRKLFVVLTSDYVSPSFVMRADKAPQTDQPGTDSFYREVGLKIRHARDQKGFTQERLAETIRLSRTSLTNIEKGRQKFLLHTFAEIASALSVAP